MSMQLYCRKIGSNLSLSKVRHKLKTISNYLLKLQTHNGQNVQHFNNLSNYLHYFFYFKSVSF